MRFDSQSLNNFAAPQPALSRFLEAVGRALQEAQEAQEDLVVLVAGVSALVGVDPNL